MNWDSVKAIIFKPGLLLGLFIFAGIFVSVQLYMLGLHQYTFPKDPFPADIMNQPKYMDLFYGKSLTEFNNYLIFKNSWFHLHDTAANYNETGLLGLYGIHPDEHWDFYKYSPTFAFFMGAFAYLPNLLGLTIWNILNAVAVYFAVRMLPFANKVQCLLLWFIGNEMLTSLSNTQSNGLMCGLMVAAYGCMQHRKIALATLWIVVATYIKPYGAIGFCMILFYPGQLKFILYSALWTILLGALPLLVIPMQTLVWEYKNWAYLIKEDAAAAVGISVAGWLHTWFGINNSKFYVTVIGVLLFLVPFVRYKQYRNEQFKLLTLASMLIWVIIFNHKAESSTYIIAVTGVAIWYFASPKANWRTALLFFVLLFTCFSTTDIFPPYVRKHFIYPYTIKAFPCILTWCAVIYDLMTMKNTNNTKEEELRETPANTHQIAR